MFISPTPTNTYSNTHTYSSSLNKRKYLVKDGKVTREGWKFLNNGNGDSGRRNNNQNSNKQNNKKGEK